MKKLLLKFLTHETASVTAFVVFSVLLFVNPYTQFFEDYTKTHLIAWIGIIISVIWFMYVFGKRHDLWVEQKCV